MTRRKTYGTAADIAAFENVGKVPEPPVGCTLRSEAERELWASIMSAKPFKDWTGITKNTAFKILKNEMLLRSGRARLDHLIDAGADAFNSDSIASDAVKNIVRLERQQLNLIRSLGLNYSAIPSKNEAREADKINDAANAIDGMRSESGLGSFMALN